MSRLVPAVVGVAALAAAALVADVPVGPGPLRAASLWERRDPRAAYLFLDNRARKVGDLLTIVISETTVFDGTEDRKLQKDTTNTAATTLTGNAKGGASSRSFSGNLSANTTSERQFEGKSNYTSNRTFTDRVTVRVKAVMPNGDLVVEGYRTRVVQDETRTLKITGMVRPVDIAPTNIVQSQYVGNLCVSYTGKGAESSYLKNGWLGKILNVVWPF